LPILEVIDGYERQKNAALEVISRLRR